MLSKISSDVNISRCIFDWELRFLLGGVKGPIIHLTSTTLPDAHIRWHPLYPTSLVSPSEPLKGDRSSRLSHTKSISTSTQQYESEERDLSVARPPCGTDIASSDCLYRYQDDGPPLVTACMHSRPRATPIFGTHPTSPSTMTSATVDRFVYLFEKTAT